MKTMKKIISLVLSVIMLLGVASVTAFAADDLFAYYFADDEMEEIYVTAFKGTVPEDGYVEIPAEIDGYTVTGIAEHTFDNLKELKGIVITESIVYIDEDAFYGCNNNIDIKVVATENEEETEDFNTEEWYENHKQDYVINGTTLVNYKGTDEIVTIPYNCTEIAAGAFKDNDYIKVVYFEKDITKIGESAFEGCSSLEDVIAGSGVTTLDIGKNAFKDTPWLDNYPSTLVTLGTTLVKYKGELTYLAIPNVLTAIAAEAFYVGHVEDTIAFKVKVPVTIELFGEDCFYLYDSMTDVYPKIIVFEGTAADEYCKAEGIDCTYAALPGDADESGVINSADSRYVLRVSAKIEAPITEKDRMEVCDITGDNKITAEDARLILRVAARLDTYSVDELLRMPRSDYEVLFAATNALSLARAYGCAYSKFAYQEINNININTNTKTYLNMFNKELTSSGKAQVVTYNQDSQEAYDNLFEISLIDATKIAEYSSVLEDNVYNFRIVLVDETVDGFDVDAETFTQKMFPAESVAHFTNAAKNKYWFNDSIDYDMTYNGCTLEMQVDVATGKILSMNVTMNYDFSITGKIMGIGIKGSNGPATATRTDVIKYTNFVYFTK